MKKKSKKVRILGRVQAGFAAPAEDELADTITIGEYLVRNKDATYLLRVEGDSMEEAGILQGDLILFERRDDAKVGDIVIALTEDGYTIKILRKHGARYYLEAANSKYPRIYPREGQVIGVVTASLRTYPQK